MSECKHLQITVNIDTEYGVRCAKCVLCGASLGREKINEILKRASTGTLTTENAELRQRVEELVVIVESSRNFMVGVSFDPALPPHIKTTITYKADELDSRLAEFEEPAND